MFTVVFSPGPPPGHASRGAGGRSPFPDPPPSPTAGRKADSRKASRQQQGGKQAIAGRQTGCSREAGRQ